MLPTARNQVEIDVLPNSAFACPVTQGAQLHQMQIKSSCPSGHRPPLRYMLHSLLTVTLLGSEAADRKIVHFQKSTTPLTEFVLRDISAQIWLVETHAVLPRKCPFFCQLGISSVSQTSQVRFRYHLHYLPIVRCVLHFHRRRRRILGCLELQFLECQFLLPAVLADELRTMFPLSF